MHDNDTNNNLQSQSSNITFGKKIYQFKLEDINTFTQQFYCNMIEYSDELKLGMHHLIDCLDLWLKEIFDDAEFDNEALIEIYNAVKLFNGDRIRATEKFNNKNIQMLQLNGQLVMNKRMSLFLARYVYLLNAILYFFSYN